MKLSEFDVVQKLIFERTHLKTAIENDRQITIAQLGITRDLKEALQRTIKAHIADIETKLVSMGVELDDPL